MSALRRLCTAGMEFEVLRKLRQTNQLEGHTGRELSRLTLGINQR